MDTLENEKHLVLYTKTSQNNSHKKYKKYNDN